jgi:2-polyprenyl-3-methyl-5-hydroxy-6-metoxy-1,4-benzoquinol methylase
MLKAKITAAYVIFRLPKLKKRTKDKVNLDYNDTSWQKISYKIRTILVNNPNTNLRILLNNPVIGPNTKFAVMDSYVRTDPSSYLDFKANKLLSLFKNKNADILELGSGFGWNLSLLRNSGHTGNLTGVDISKEGISLASYISDHYNLNIDYKVLDITDQLQLNNLFQQNMPDVIFTYQVFEQLPHESESLVKSLIKIAPSRSFILVESSASLRPRNFSDLLSKIYVWKKDYQTALYRTLKDFERKNLIRDLYIERLRCSHKIGNESAIYRFSSI